MLRKKIKPLREPKRFRDLISLLEPGFLQSDVSIADDKLTMKTINFREMRSSGELAKEESRLVVYLLFFSIYKFNDDNVLYLREDLRDNLLEFLMGLPADKLSRLKKELLVLNDRKAEAGCLLEEFIWSYESRSLWTQFNASGCDVEKITGIKGLKDMGWNDEQRVWVRANIELDKAETTENQFEVAKLIGSFINPKAAKRLDMMEEQYDSDMSDMKDRGVTVLKPGSESAEALVEELNKQMSGQKDSHDLMVEKYEKQMMEDLKKKAEEKKAVQKDPMGKGLLEGGDQVVSIEAYMEEMKARRSHAS